MRLLSRNVVDDREQRRRSPAPAVCHMGEKEEKVHLHLCLIFKAPLQNISGSRATGGTHLELCAPIRVMMAADVQGMSRAMQMHKANELHSVLSTRVKCAGTVYPSATKSKSLPLRDHNLSLTNPLPSSLVKLTTPVLLTSTSTISAPSYLPRFHSLGKVPQEWPFIAVAISHDTQTSACLLTWLC